MSPNNNKVVDVLIIGGGPAGLTVASTIVRQLHTATVFDSGVYRNARTEHLHGMPGFDHVDPEVFRTKAKGDLLRRYETVRFKKTHVEEVRRLESGNFQVTDGWGKAYEGRKVVLATGVQDIMPQIEGYGSCWGRGIFHCLFCDGYENRNGASAGLFAFDMFANADVVSQVGNMVLQLSKTVRIYTNGNDDIASEVEANAWRPDFQTRVVFEKRAIRSLKMVSYETSEVMVTLEDGTQIKESFIAHHPLIEMNGHFVEQLGLETGSQGEIKVNAPFNETSVHGVFAAGDAASQMRVVPNAIYGGSLAGGGLIAQLQAEKVNVLN